VLPVHPRSGASAIRVLIRAEKGGSASLKFCPGLDLNDEDGRPTSAAEAILREGEILPIAKS
jgi:tRNA1(Val) A37 N6-methylase TrmN6